MATTIKSVRFGDTFKKEIKEFQKELGMTGREHAALPTTLRIGVTLGTQYLRYLKKVVPFMKPANLSIIHLNMRLENEAKWKEYMADRRKKVVPTKPKDPRKVLHFPSDDS